jgi:hypothetical protein
VGAWFAAANLPRRAVRSGGGIGRRRNLIWFDLCLGEEEDGAWRPGRAQGFIVWWKVGGDGPV